MSAQAMALFVEHICQFLILALDCRKYCHIFRELMELYLSTGGNIPGLVYVAVIVFTAFFDALFYMICWYLDMEKADIILLRFS